MMNFLRGMKRFKSGIHMAVSSRARRRKRLANAWARSKVKLEQLELLSPRRGGKRCGAGRKPKGERVGVPHRTWLDFQHVHPLHVTTWLVCGAPNLRRP